MEPVCLDPTRYNKLKAAESRAINKERRENAKTLSEQLLQATQGEITSRKVAVLCDFIWRTLSRGTLKNFVDEITANHSDLLPYIQRESTLYHDVAKCYDLLSQKSAETLLNLTVRAYLEEEIRTGIEYRNGQNPQTDWFLGLANFSREKSEGEPQAELEETLEGTDIVEQHCENCGSPIPPDLLGTPVHKILSFKTGTSQERRHIFLDSGVMVMEDDMGGHYCPNCSDGINYCRVCGCTEEVPCEGETADYWIEINDKTGVGLCSQCVEVPKPVEEFTPDTTAMPDRGEGLLYLSPQELDKAVVGL